MTRAFDQLHTALADSSRQTALAAAQGAWVDYRDKQCAFESSLYAGGSMHPMQYLGCREAMTADRAARLRSALAAERR
jgi:uncharacterized protein YecT (DUF1311 family)